LNEGQMDGAEQHDDHACGHDQNDAAAARAGIELQCLRAPGGRQRTPARRLAEREGIVHPCWYRHPSDQLNPGSIACVSEITDVLAAIGSLAASGRRMALATIVAVRGSTYRRPGARLLVPEDGVSIGNISAGCVEGGILDIACLLLVESLAL